MLRIEKILTMLAILIPKLRTQFAEFLNQSYLARLRLLASPTCVGFDTGVTTLKLRSFSWKHGIIDFGIRLVISSQA